MSTLTDRIDKLEKKLTSTQEELAAARLELEAVKKGIKFDLTESGMYLIVPKSRWAGDVRLLIKSNQATEENDKLVSIDASGNAGYSAAPYWLANYDVVKKFTAADLVEIFKHDQER